VLRLASPTLTLASHDAEPAEEERDLERPQRTDIPSIPDGPLLPLHSSPSGQPLTAFFREDLELLHHYTTVTYSTLLDDDAFERVWRINVPQEAARCDFLMHGILGLAAMHLRRLRPESATYYNRLASKHYSEGLSLFRLILNHVTRSTASPVFIFSSLLVCMSLQLVDPSDQQDMDCMLSLDTIIDAFKLERGVKDVLQLTWDWLLGTPFTPLLFVKERMCDCLITLDDDEALDKVDACVRNDLAADPMLKDYRDAIQSLRVVYSCRTTAAKHKAGILSWPVMVSAAFYDDIIKKEPLAMVILAYYGVLLNELRNVWWVGRAAKRLLRNCAELSRGKYRELVAWAERRADASSN
jgi:hypothetical protein